jgi:F-type H+-transporting ATPase subunit delta
VSRRSLAQYGADQLLAGKPAKAVAQHLVAVLVESRKTDEVQFLLEDVAWELEHRQALAIGKVTSAHPLTAKLQTEVEAQLKQATGAKQVLVESEIDKSILGGLRVQTAARIWDNTVSRKLSELREVF